VNEQNVSGSDAEIIYKLNHNYPSLSSCPSQINMIYVNDIGGTGFRTHNVGTVERLNSIPSHAT
jgi:hypothetical protein